MLRPCCNEILLTVVFLLSLIVINLCLCYFASTRAGDLLEWYSYMPASRWAWSFEAYHRQCPRRVARRAVVLTVRTAFSIPLPSIVVGPMLQRLIFPRYWPWTVLRRAAVLALAHYIRVETAIAEYVEHGRSTCSPVQNMFFIFPHLHPKWGYLPEGFCLHIHCQNPTRLHFQRNTDYTVSYHRPTTPPDL